MPLYALGLNHATAPVKVRERIAFQMESLGPALRDLIKRWVAPPKRLSRKDTVAFLRRACSSYFHPVGTCAMGPGRDAVVDAELRVRGVEGLRIADASVMPTIPSGNTNAPVVMIGEFASRLLVAG